MKLFPFLLLAIVLLAAAGIFWAARTRRSKTLYKGTFAKRPVATANEQALYWRLESTFPLPEYILLAQVSFGALLTAKGGSSRFSFSQKIADFVLLDKTFKVLAVIELDDSSHRGREGKDASRDAMLAMAGYKILRYKSVPQPEKLLQDLASDKQLSTRPSALT
ncbi:MAG: DUF2726 domain-containing protein [Burkholderiaceae bacterium]